MVILRECERLKPGEGNLLGQCILFDYHITFVLFDRRTVFQLGHWHPLPIGTLNVRARRCPLADWTQG
jgi:hypothetical protein